MTAEVQGTNFIAVVIALTSDLFVKGSVFHRMFPQLGVPVGMAKYAKSGVLFLDSCGK